MEDRAADRGETPTAKCLQCDHLLRPGQELCVECGAPAEWSQGAYALRSESVESLRSIRRGAGLMVWSWMAQIGILVGVIALIDQSGRDPTSLEKLLINALDLMILGLFLVGAFALRPKTRNRLDVIQRPLNNGFVALIVGIGLAGIAMGLMTIFKLAKMMNLITESPESLADAMALTMVVGYGLWGHGCCVIAPVYIRRLRGKPPRRPGYLGVAVIIVLVSAVLILAWFGPNGGLKPTDEIVRAVTGCVMLVCIVKMLSGGIHMGRLWRAVGKLLKNNQISALNN